MSGYNEIVGRLFEYINGESVGQVRDVLDESPAKQKILFEQYETLRNIGAFNMFDKRWVELAAMQFHFDELKEALGNGQYESIIKRYGMLERKFGKKDADSGL